MVLASRLTALAWAALSLPFSALVNGHINACRWWYAYSTKLAVA